jgi:hypothetical protein
MKKLLIGLLVLSAHLTTVAQTFSVRCKFSDGQVTDFEKGTPHTVRKSDMSDLVFDQIDTKKNSARLIGNVGVETVKVIDGTNVIHLIEITGSGNMNLTTLYVTNKSAATFPVAHSRHVTSATSALPSQYVGLCTRLL